MWGRRKKAATPENAPVAPLKEALRQARIDSAERTGLILEMRDAEAARLEILNDALDPVFADIPQGVEIFDRGVSRGDVPRLWIDIVAYVLMGRDKRTYRFVQDTRYGRKVLHESADIPDMAKAITRYVAARLIERERALVNGRHGLARRDSKAALARLRHVRAGICDRPCGAAAGGADLRRPLS